MPGTVRTNGTMRTHKPAVTRVPQRILVDTGLFFAYYEPGDQYHEEATIPLNTWWDQPGPSRLVVAFPVLYETLNTRFVQDRRRMAAWTRNWSAWRAHGRLEYCDDEPYRLKAFDECVRRMRYGSAARPPIVSSTQPGGPHSERLTGRPRRASRRSLDV